MNHVTRQMVLYEFKNSSSKGLRASAECVTASFVLKHPCLDKMKGFIETTVKSLLWMQSYTWRSAPSKIRVGHQPGGTSPSCAKDNYGSRKHVFKPLINYCNLLYIDWPQRYFRTLGLLWKNMRRKSSRFSLTGSLGQTQTPLSHFVALGYPNNGWSNMSIPRYTTKHLRL